MFMIDKSAQCCCCFLVIILLDMVTARRTGSANSPTTNNEYPRDLTADVVDIKNIVTDNESHEEIDNNIDRKKKHRNRTRGVRWW